MAGECCGGVVARQLDRYFDCGVCKKQFYFPIRQGGYGCGQIVDKKLDDYVGCGVCK